MDLDNARRFGKPGTYAAAKHGRRGVVDARRGDLPFDSYQRRNGNRGKKRFERLADHLLGYRLTGSPEVVRYGPQPIEGILSEASASFGGALPRGGALNDQDILEITSILDYRAAKEAVRIFRDSKGKQERESAFNTFKEHPELLEVVGKMSRAQKGLKVRASARTLQRDGDLIASGVMAENENNEPAEV